MDLNVISEYQLAISGWTSPTHASYNHEKLWFPFQANISDMFEVIFRILACNLLVPTQKDDNCKYSGYLPKSNMLPRKILTEFSLATLTEIKG